MSNDRKRHLMLKALYVDDSGEYKEIKGLTSDELALKIGVNNIDFISLSHEFLQKGYMTRMNDKYYINTKGVNAFKDKIYLNRLWYRNWSNWLAIIAIIISIITLFKSEK